MLRTALEFIRKELDAYIADREQDDPGNYTAGDIVDLLSITKPDGAINIDDKSHITMMVTGVEEERREGKRPKYVPTDDKQYLRLNPPIDINVYILFVAQSKHYETALRDLSGVIGFFQANSVFDPQKFPGLNAGVAKPDTKPWQLIERLSFHLHNLTFEQQNNMWGMVGSKYIPNVVYKMSLLTIFETRGKQKVPSITEINYEEN